MGGLHRLVLLNASRKRFGGGRKSILPGISGRETIFHNNAFSLDAAQLRSNPAIGNGVLKGNPLHEDIAMSINSCA